MKKVILLLLLIINLFAIDTTVTYFEQKDISKDIDILKDSFIHLESKNSNFGFTKSVFWIKVKLSNNTNLQSKQSLHFSYALLDYIDIYEFKKNRLILKREMGDLRVYKNDGFLKEPTYFLNIDSKEEKILIIRVQTQGSMNIDLIVSDYEKYVDYGVKKSQILMLFYGSVLIMLLYNFVLYLYIRDKSYLIYIFFHISYLMFTLSYHGYAFAYLWSFYPHINSFAVPFIMSVSSTLAVIFVIDFLHIKEFAKKVYKLLYWLVMVNIFITLLVFIVPYNLSILMVSLMSFISVVLILGSSFHSHIVSKNPNAKFFALAWGFLLLGIFTVNLKNNGILPTNIVTNYAAFIGAFIELVLLSSALAYRYKLQNEEIIQKDITLLRQSRLASMGEMIANIAHQWRQPLHRINLSLSIIETIIEQDKINNKMIDNKLKSSQKNLQYMSDTIDDFTNYFRADKLKEHFNIYEILENMKILLESRLKNTIIKMPKKNKQTIYGFKNEFLQVVLVIINNALDNFVEKYTKNREINILINSNKDYIYLTISDNGGGINEEQIDKIFDPYYTTKFKEEGTGIGLYMAKLLIEQSMDGELSVLNTSKGACFSIKMREKKDNE